MNHYYYILGVEPTASADEIKQAYRKLSVKFHPDKNGGDTFFEDRFKEINQAYEFLSDPARRAQYDRDRIGQNGSPSSTRHQDRQAQAAPHSNPPLILSFRTDKTELASGEAITFFWDTQHATSVELKPFGPVAVRGQKTVKPLGFNKLDGLSVELRATNATGEITGRKAFIYKRNLESGRTTKKPANRVGMIEANRRSGNRLAYIVLAALLALIILLVILIIV